MFWTGVRSNGPSDVGCHDIVLTLPLQDERGEERRRREGRPATRREVGAGCDDAADADVGSGDNSDED